MPVPGALAMVMPPGAIDVPDAGHAEHRIGAEVQRIEEIIVDAAIEDVDRLIPLRRAHRDAPVDDAQVMPLDQFGAHMVGQIAMFVIGAVVDARGQHRDRRRPAARGRRAGGERFEQVDRIVADLAHRHFREQLGKHLEHRFAVFEHVRHPRRGARIVLEHVKFIGAGAHDVGAADVGIDAAGRIEPHHHRQKRRRCPRSARSAPGRRAKSPAGDKCRRGRRSGRGRAVRCRATGGAIRWPK